MATSAPVPHTALSRLDLFFGLVLAAMLATMVCLAPDFGITWDEPDQQNYGASVLRFYTSAFRDTDASTFKLNYLNGGVFDCLTVLVQKAWTAVWPETRLYDIRHVCNSLAGWLAICGAGLLARRLFGTAAGILAALFLFLSPRFFGDAMNNPKDIPFAAAAVWCLYALSFIRPRYPFVSLPSFAGLVAALALLLNIRVGGLLFVGYAAGLLLFYACRDAQMSSPKRSAVALLVFAVGLVMALCLGTLFWPWALRNPFVYPFVALKAVSQYPWTGTLAFGGKAYSGTSVPWDYIPRLYAITSPIAVLAGGLAAVVILLARGGAGVRAKCLALCVAAFFPLAYVILKKAVLYDGLRHLLFVYPPFAVLAAAGWVSLFETAAQTPWRLWARRAAQILLVVALALGLRHPVDYALRNHPLEIVYYNELVGGLRGAADKYDLDYWGVSYKSAVDWIRGRERDSGRVVRIFAPEGELGGHLVKTYVAQFPELSFTSDFQSANYVVFLNRLLFREVVNHLMKENSRVHAITAEGAPLCFVVW